MSGTGPHRHRWSQVDFFVDGERPMVRSTCACGETRTIRAFDRTWEPSDVPISPRRPRELPAQ
jgi:hypothetical protein